MTRSPQVQVLDTSLAGIWRVYARRPRKAPIEVTFFRGAPTEYGPMSLSDPFGPQSANLRFPKITMWDAIGVGELAWLDYGTDIDIVWDGPVPTGYPGTRFAWEGYAASFDYSTDGGLSVGLVGAMLQLDNYLAKPEYPQRPIPYEWAIRKQWDDKPDLRMRSLKVEFPAWWQNTYTAPAKRTQAYLIPTHVRPGQNWTGLTTRQTGSWEPALTSYIQTLLTSMYTSRGRWTLELDAGRTPVLRHKDTPVAADISTLVIDPATPGVDVSLNVDWSQSLNVAYGQGVSLSGEGYSGMVVTHDGTRTSYDPLASLRSVHPLTDNEGWLDTTRMRKEVNLQLQTGLSYDQAKRVGRAHLARFADPGVTGTITLTVDPMLNGSYLPRTLIKAGMALQLPHLFGRKSGLLLHITNVNTDLANQTVTLSVDSKFRDALTVDEVKLRGRDALSVTRQLIGGQYSPAIPDQLLPWDYAAGSGYIPSGPALDSRLLFAGMPDDVFFPWTEWTTAHPPSDKSYRNCYIKIPAKNAQADKNWSYEARRLPDVPGQLKQYGIPIRLAQAGQIRMIQLAAFDVNGNLLPVKFHFSIYSNRGVNVNSMPRLTANDTDTADGYAIGQHYPFFQGAWERYKLDGTQIQTEDPVSVSSAGLQRAWGTRDVPAGCWPAASSALASPTGMLVDEGVWDFNTTQNVGLTFNQYTASQSSPDAGHMYAMIYCESDVDVYFVGRMFRVEPGAQV